MGGGNSLNIIRIGGAYEQFTIVICSDLNGCISNPLYNYGGYSSTWHSDYPRGNVRDITQNNADSRYYCLFGSVKEDIDYHLSSIPYSYFWPKNVFHYSNYDSCQLRPIIEFKE